MKNLILLESINEWAKLFIKLFEEYSSSKLQFSKLHSWVFHICSSIRKFGTINGYTTETYESLHKDYVKKPYKLTNKKEIEKQIIKIICRKAIIIESSSKEIPKTPIVLKYSKKLYEFCIQNVEIYIQTRMNDPDLEKEMKLGFEKFLECLDAYLDFYDQKLSEHEEIDIKFRIYSGVTLKYGAKMRANNKFHKRPIFKENSPVQKGKNFEIKIEKLLTDTNIKYEITGPSDVYVGLNQSGSFMEIFYVGGIHVPKIDFGFLSGVTLKYGAKMRANNKFHKRPIFSNIAVEMNPDEIFEYISDNGVCFAQVLLITEIIMNYEEPMHLALVQ
ncbi:hypothetical protein Glove_305g11 [Diversispora epigaea]|uniref:Uncharacterized protein n=1 Tax=Diversispora epigaea TaxID=1348612 RepID=A0A397HUB8_9GLOM|nr:hypothetical protein Glove_305g11 [Diversispora epigaea]